MNPFHRRFFVLTGAVGFAGGIATLLIGPSCDVECVPDDRPSILLRLHTTDGTVQVPQTATSVTYRFRGFDDDGDSAHDSLTTPILDEDGYCLDADCTRWVVGTDQAGIFDIEAVVCGKTYHEQVRVPLADDDCHPEVQHVAIAVTCDEEPERPLRDEIRCDEMARPSTMVFVGQTADDYLMPVAVERVWFEHAGRTAVATCAWRGATAGRCSVWTAGWELEGRIRVSAQWCDTVVSETVTVGRTADGCHVDTELVMLPVSTLGCLTSEAPPGAGDPTPYGGPESVTAEPGEAPSPAGNADDFRIALPPGDPFGPRIQG
jgi:hypothetical protein